MGNYRDREITLYVNEKRRQAFDQLKGKQVVIEIDNDDGEYELVSLDVTTDLKEMFYQAFDAYVDRLSRAE